MGASRNPMPGARRRRSLLLAIGGLLASLLVLIVSAALLAIDGSGLYNLGGAGFSAGGGGSLPTTDAGDIWRRPVVRMADPGVQGLPAGSVAPALRVADGGPDLAPPLGCQILGPAVEAKGSREIFPKSVVLDLPLRFHPDPSEGERIFVATRVANRWIPLAARPRIVGEDSPVARCEVRHFSWYRTLVRSAGYGLPVEPGIAGLKRVVVLVHGLDSSPDTWLEMQMELSGRLESGTTVLAFSYPNDQGIKLSADFLKEEIADLRARSPQCRIDLVGHSMGGLVARWYIERLGGDSVVKSLTMIGTPNHGSRLASFEGLIELKEHLTDGSIGEWGPLAFVIDGAGQAAADLLPDSLFLRELNPPSWSPPQGVEYRIWAGTTPLVEFRTGKLFPELTPGSGDGAVSVESASLDSVPVQLMPLHHLEIHRNLEVIEAVCDGLGLTMAAALALRGTPEQAWEVLRDQLLAGNEVAAWQFLTERSRNAIVSDTTQHLNAAGRKEMEEAAAYFGTSIAQLRTWSAEKIILRALDKVLAQPEVRKLVSGLRCERSRIEGDRAVCSIRNGAGQTFERTLVRVRGVWKLEFSP